MTRTNVDIDDELALERLVGEQVTRDEMLAMEGTGWGGLPTVAL